MSRKTIYRHLEPEVGRRQPDKATRAVAASPPQPSPQPQPQSTAPASGAEALPATLRPVRARIRRPDEPLTEQQRDLHDRLARQRAAISKATCPTCGNKPVQARARWQQRQDLAVVWLYADPDHPGEFIERRHCAECQPHQ